MKAGRSINTGPDQKLRIAHLNVVGTSEDTPAAAAPKSRPVADTLWRAVKLLMNRLPAPGGSASRVDAGIANCPALAGAKQKKLTLPFMPEGLPNGPTPCTST